MKGSDKMTSLQIQSIKIENPLQRTIGIIGQKGSGKTITMILIWRECRKKKIPCVFFDTLNCIHGDTKIVIRKWPDKETKEKMVKIAVKAIKGIIKRKESIVIGFKKLIPSEIQGFCNSLFQELEIYNCMVFFDELHEYTPELIQGSEEIQRFIRHCRNNNNGVVFNTQRPALIKKNVFALSDLLIIFRTMWIKDLKIIEEILKNAGYAQEKIDEVKKDIQGLSTFEGFKIDFI